MLTLECCSQQFARANTGTVAKVVREIVARAKFFVTKGFSFLKFNRTLYCILEKSRHDVIGLGNGILLATVRRTGTPTSLT